MRHALLRRQVACSPSSIQGISYETPTRRMGAP
jgi:hypothetical protein